MTLLSSARPLNAIYDAALVDLDGVVYIGSQAVPAAPEAVEKARAAGMRVVFVTNNAARTPAAVAEQLTALDVAADAQSVVTSADAAARMVAERFPAGSPVLVVGDTGLRHAVWRRGLRPVSVSADRPVAVIQGYSPRMDYDLITEGGLAVSQGALFVVSNNDSTTPMDRGILPANGSFSRVIANATGQEPVVAGKPMRPLHEEGVLRTGARAPLVVGDRLDTDIEGATSNEAASMLVLSGVTKPADLITAPTRHQPDYLAWDLGGMNLPHPETQAAAGEAHCGGWTAAVREGHLRLTGEGDRLDGLRALCGAAWSAPQEAGSDLDSRDALAQLGW
ncbi:HAD-IIA family hydrolase [Allosalinactinospora lopnorensis]|uniref:HAD-IIA family hydrolase n=1 Tax=Allosalinactinospora lopnorensis TaxID=1352348 RepID=UPI000623BCFC|nr:HAD-IIA family hydrolase [Allosalinactinospora lopnorensis]